RRKGKAAGTPASKEARRSRLCAWAEALARRVNRDQGSACGQQLLLGGEVEVETDSCAATLKGGTRLSSICKQLGLARSPWPTKEFSLLEPASGAPHEARPCSVSPPVCCDAP
ncbi:hypothetical protein GOP47_0030605, partial [Adiantum capillus-veneris]